MNPVITIEKIISYLNSLNVPIVGFTEPFEDVELAKTLQRHEDQGHYIYFGETTLEQRQNIEAVFPVCKSIIVIGIPYNSRKDNLLSDEDEKKGFVSNMAWEYDYHKVVKAKLERLQVFLRDLDNTVETKIQVDIGPLIDRHIALKSGIGAYGKNQCLMHKQYGTEFYIGYLLINKELAIDEPRELIMRDKRCESCSNCVKSCPGNVLTDEFDFYGQGCISYLTQKKEYLSWDERILIGNSIYGCDICQLVCPENRKKVVIPKEYERQTLNRIDPKALLLKSNKQLMRDYKETGFSWRGAKVLKRNAVIVIANQRKYDDCEFLEKLLEEANSYLVPYILWALYRSGSPNIVTICEKFFSETEDEIIKNECYAILVILK